MKALACGALLLLGSCHTVEAVTAAPVEFWITAETIGLALLEDLRQILGFFLPVL